MDNLSSTYNTSPNVLRLPLHVRQSIFQFEIFLWKKLHLTHADYHALLCERRPNQNPLRHRARCPGHDVDRPSGQEAGDAVAAGDLANAQGGAPPAGVSEYLGRGGICDEGGQRVGTVVPFPDGRTFITSDAAGF